MDTHDSPTLFGTERNEYNESGKKNGRKVRKKENNLLRQFFEKGVGIKQTTAPGLVILQLERDLTVFHNPPVFSLVSGLYSCYLRRY